MKTWKRYSEPSGIIEAINFNNVPRFTKASELHGRGKSCTRTVVFKSGGVRRTFTLNSYRNSKTTSVESSDGSHSRTFQVFSSVERAVSLFDKTIAQYEADSRWTRFTMSPPKQPMADKPSRFVAIGLRVMRGQLAACTAVSNTMAKRIAAALNEHEPNRRGI